MATRLSRIGPGTSRLQRTGHRTPAVLLAGAVAAFGFAAPALALDVAPVPGGAKLDRQLWEQGHAAPSGMAVSTKDSKLLWAIGGGTASGKVFGIEGTGARKGHYRAAYTITGVSRVDWQALASGPDEDGNPSLFIGDIGNGNADGPGVVKVHRLAEPSGIKSGNLSATAFHLKYPKGGPSAQTLMVHPDTGRIYLLTSGAKASLYVAPETLDPVENNVLELVGPAPANITDGAFLPDGRVVLRTATAMYIAPSIEQIKDVEAFDLPGRDKGAAIAALDDDTVVVSSSGAGTKFHRVPVPADVALSGEAPDDDSGEGAKKGDRGSTGTKAIAGKLATQGARTGNSSLLFWGAFLVMAIVALLAVASSPLVRPKPKGRRARR